MPNIDVLMTEKVWDELSAEADSSDKTLGQFVMDAISLYKFVQERPNDGLYMRPAGEDVLYKINVG